MKKLFILHFCIFCILENVCFAFFWHFCLSRVLCLHYFCFCLCAFIYDHFLCLLCPALALSPFYASGTLPSSVHCASVNLCLGSIRQCPPQRGTQRGMQRGMQKNAKPKSERKKTQKMQTKRKKMQILHFLRLDFPLSWPPFSYCSFFLRFGFVWPCWAFLLGYEIGVALGWWIFTMNLFSTRQNSALAVANPQEYEPNQRKNHGRPKSRIKKHKINATKMQNQNAKKTQNIFFKNTGTG